MKIGRANGQAERETGKMDGPERSIAARCACGLTFTLDEWSKLDLAGVQEDEDTMLEMRKLRRALGLLRDIDRATAGLSHEIVELDRGSVQRARGGTRSAIEAGVRAVDLERERCAKIADEIRKPV